MYFIQQDIFGSASKIKEVEVKKKLVIKEASGDNRFKTLEIVARMFLFKPYIELSATDDPNKNVIGVASAAHKLVLLLLKRIQEPDIHTSTIGKVKGCLNRIVIVLLHNTTVDDVDLLPFVYMLVYTFVFGDKPIKSNKNEGKYNDSKIEEKFHIKIR